MTKVHITINKEALDRIIRSLEFFAEEGGNPLNSFFCRRIKDRLTDVRKGRVAEEHDGGEIVQVRPGIEAVPTSQLQIMIWAVAFAAAAHPRKFRRKQFLLLLEHLREVENGV